MDFGIQTNLDTRKDICPWGILHFLAVDLGAGAQSSETLSSLGLTLQKESGVDTNRYPEN